MAFINPLTVSLGAKVVTSLGKKYGPKVVSTLKNITSKKNLTEKLLVLGIGSSQLAQLKLMPKAGETKKQTTRQRLVSSSKTNRKNTSESEKPFKKTKTRVKIDGKEIKEFNKGGLLVSATKYFKNKVNKDN